MQTEKRYRAVVLGAGRIGALWEADVLRARPATHAGAYWCDPRIELVALADPSPGSLREAARRFRGIRCYADPDRCLAQERPDIVSIAAPTPSHLRLLSSCCRYGSRLVICEKPVADSIAGAQRMDEMARRAQITVVVNHQRRFFASFQEGRKDIQAGRLGRVQQVTAYYSNGLMNNGTHLVDALRFLLRDEVESALGLQNRRNRAHPKGDGNVDGILVFRKGVIATLQSLDQRHYAIHELKLLGEKGALIIRNYGYEMQWAHIEPSRFFSQVSELREDCRNPSLRSESMVKGAIDHGIALLSGRAKPTSTVGDAIAALKVLDALRRSADLSGKRFNL